MKQRYEQFFPIVGATKMTGPNYIQAEVYYHLGGYNVFTGKIEPRGFYISASPVTKANCLISYTAFTGIKHCFLECSRYSEKKFTEAMEYYKKQIIGLITCQFPQYPIDFIPSEIGM